MKALNLITLLLVIIGGLNWGLEALGANLVEALFGAGTAAANTVYMIVAVSAVWQLAPFFRAISTSEVSAEAHVRPVVR